MASPAPKILLVDARGQICGAWSGRHPNKRPVDPKGTLGDTLAIAPNLPENKSQDLVLGSDIKLRRK